MATEESLVTRIPVDIGWDRIRSMTPEYVNERIQRQMEGEIAYLKNQPDGAVQRKLYELEREWNIDQALMANFAALGFAGVLAGALGWRRWLTAPLVQLGFLFMHASKGWCPPTALFRRLGFRTQKEIEVERRILKEYLQSHGGEETRHHAA